MPVSFPWEELPAVSKQYNIDYQRLDEHFIRNMERIANIAGYCLTKL